MSEDQGMNAVFLIGALILVLSALSVRRVSAGLVIRSLLSWAIMGAIAFLVIQNRHQIGAVFAGLSAKLGLDDQQVEGETVRIKMSPDGHFWARVSLNGVERRMLIDSGATITAISIATAQAAGIATDGGGFPVVIETANGSVAARRGSVDELALGPLRTADLGVVVSENFGDLDVLGMNFLSRLGSWRVQDNVLVLEPKRGANDAPADDGDDTTAAEPDESAGYVKSESGGTNG